MKNGCMKRLFSLLLVLFMVFSLLPTSVFAAEETHDHDHTEETTVDTTTTPTDPEGSEPVTEPAPETEADEIAVKIVADRSDWTDEMLTVQEMIDADVIEYYLGYYGFTMPAEDLTALQWAAVQAEIEDIIVNKMEDGEPDQAIMSIREVEYMMQELALTDEQAQSIVDANPVYVEFATQVNEHGTAVQTLDTISGLSDSTIALNGDTSKWTASGTTLTGSVQGSYLYIGYTAASTEITITNNKSEAAVLSFVFSTTGNHASDRSVTVDGTEYTNATATAYSKELAAGTSITIKIAVEIAKSDNTFGISISDLSLTVPSAADVTVVYDNTLGKVTVGGTEAANGEVIGFPATGYTVVATPNSGATFVGWINENDEIISTMATYNFIPSADTTLKAVFATDASPAWFAVDDTYLLNDLNDATAKGTKIVLAADGTLPAGEYTIPSGDTLLIPYDAAGSLNTSTPAVDLNTTNYTYGGTSVAQTTPYRFRTLTMANGANITVKGAISVNARMYAGGTGSVVGGVNGAYGHIKMETGSTITVNSGANLYCWGYITGSGSVVVESGGTAYENFQVMDWRGGSCLTSMIENGGGHRVFPMSQYYVQNIEVPVTLKAGAIENGYTASTITLVGAAGANVPFIGPSGMFNITSGYIVKDYNESTDRLEIDVYGELTMKPLQLSMELGVGGATNLDSGKFELPINGNITVDVHTGGLTITQDVILLPGAEVIIGEDANCSLDTDKNFYLFDRDQWFNSSDAVQEDGTVGWEDGKNGYVGTANGAKIITLNYAPGRGEGKEGISVRSEDSLEDAKVVVNGTVDLSKGNLWTTNSGANICSDGNGVIIMKRNNATTFEQAIPTGDAKSVKYYTLQATSAQLKNADGTYTATQIDAEAGEQTGMGTYQYIEGIWTQICNNNDHTFTDDSGKMAEAATCTTAQKNYAKCENCPIESDSVTIEIGEALGHDMADATCLLPATCKRENCGYTDPEAPALGHSFVKEASDRVATEADCTHSAQHYIKCDRCDMTTDQLDAEDQKYKAVVVFGDPLDHSFTDKPYMDVVVNQATCTQAAEYYVQCDRCSEHTTEKTVSYGELAPHKYNNEDELIGEVKEAATCVKEAVHWDLCTVCKQQSDKVGDTATQIGEKAEHSFTTKASSQQATPADCENAATYRVQCDNCTAVSETVTVPVGSAKGHSFTTKASSQLATAADCENAATYYVQCDNCTAVSDSVTVAVGTAKGHSFTNKASNEVATKATCTVATTYYVQCDNCTAIDHEKAPVFNGDDSLGHGYEQNLDSGVKAQEATCYSLQKNYVKCDRCDVHTTEKTVEVAGTLKEHAFDKTPSANEAEPATCTQPAKYYVKCDNAGCTAISDTLTAEYGNTAPHSFTNVASDQQVAAADCDSAAVYKVKCDNCTAVSTTETVSVGDPLGHLFEETGVASGVTANEKTCTTRETRYVVCSRDGCNVNSSVMADKGEVPIVVEVGDAPIGHQFTVKGDIVTENNCKTNTPAVWKGKCSACGAQSDSEENYITADKAEHGEEDFVDIAPTCEKPNGMQVVCKDCSNVFTTDYLTSGDPAYMAPLGHNYKVVFTWNGYEVTGVTLTCQRENCGDVQTPEWTVTSETTDATCAAAGKTVYTAKVTVDGKNYNDSKEETIDQLTHTYGEPEFTWVKDYSSATATFTCTRETCTDAMDGHSVAENCNVTSATTDATCAAAGKTVYTATVSFEGEEYTDTKEEPIAQLTHTYGEPEFTWAEDYSSATATYACSKCSAKVENEPCTVTKTSKDAGCTTEGEVKFTATIQIGKDIYSDSKTQYSAVLGHDYKADFTWSGHEVISVTLTCQREDCSATQIIKDTAVASVTTDATCAAAGKTVYTATVSFEGKEYTDTKEEPIAQLTHTYGEPEFTWTKDYSSVTATFTCTRETCTDAMDGHSVTENCNVTSVTTDATCAAAGKTVHTATVNFGGKDYSDTKEEPIAQLTHTYGEPEFTWAEDYSSASATFTCTRETCTEQMTDHAKVVICEVSSKTTAGADCQTKGTIVHTAVVELNGKSYQDTETLDGPVGGHSRVRTVIEPTCEEGGYTLYTCKLCSEYRQETTVTSALGHDMAPATCTAPATCKRAGCGHTEGDPLPHSFTNKDSGTVASQASCSAPEMHFVQCDNCTAVSDTDTVAYGNPLPHSFNEKASDQPASKATCTEAARYYVQCDNCDAVTTTKTVAVGTANGHAFNEKASNQQATAADCENAATYYVQCDNCTEVSADKTVPYGNAKGHSYTDKASGELASAATCTAAATYYVQCDNCDAVTQGKTVSVGQAKGHSFGSKASDEIASPATCISVAKYYVQCDNCDAVTKDKTVGVGNTLPHSYTTKASSQLASAATCTAAATYYVQCDDCNAFTTEQIVAVGTAKGHSYTAKKSDQLASAATCTAAATYYVQCDNCTEVSADKTVPYGNAKGHSYTDKASGELASVATCTAAAKYYVQCDNCDAVTQDKTVSVGEPVEHTYITAASTKLASAATCTEAATYYVLCDQCKTAVSEDKTVSVGQAKGHSFQKKPSDQLASAATCTAAAIYYVQCDNCDVIHETLTVSVGEKLPHSFTKKASKTIKSAATCEEAAVYYVQCDTCTIVSDTVTVVVGTPLGHSMAPATCEQPSICRRNCGKTEGEPLGHNMSEATCLAPSTCLNGCGKTEGEKLEHVRVEIEELPAMCEEPGHKAGVQCAVCETVLSGMQVIPATGHMLLEMPAKKPTFGNPGWEAYERCLNCNYTTMVEIPALPMPSVKTYDEFIESLTILEQWTADYVAENPSKDPLGIMIEYIRTGVDRYNSGSWNIMAGYEDPDFAEYISKREDEYNAQFDDVEDMVKVTALKDIHEFVLPNGDGVDFGHMFGTMDITYHNNFSQNHADVAGWAGDLVDLLTTSDRHDVYTPDEDGNYPTIEEMTKEIGEKYLNHDIAGEDDQFGHSDMYGDLDGFYVMYTLQQQGYETGDLTKIMKAYFTEDLTDEDRAEFFLKNRLDGVSTRNAVRDAVYSEYVSNKVISTLEGTRDFKADDVSQMRIACCYAFADYLCKLGGDYVEVPDNQYYTVFESDFSVLAPGITQEIKKATTADNKQIVYYIATADINRDDVNVYANYNENDPIQGWKMSRVQDQAQAAQDKYGDPDSPLYIENYNVITSINADGFNMSTGEPSGVLVMGGVEYHEPNGNGFFGILKDGSAVIGTTAEYYEMKDSVLEAVSGFGTMLVVDGEIAISRTDNYYSDRASRTAVGITRSGKVIFMVLDGRQEPVSCGGSMQEIAQIMLEAGCYYAVNLDGGGSTTYVAKPEGEDSLRVVSKPSDGFARSVATSLMMVSTAPSSTTFDHAMVESTYDYLTPNSVISVTAKGVSATGNEAELPEGAYWAVDDTSKATIAEDGTLTGVSLGTVTVNLMVGDTVIGSKQIQVVNPDTVYFTRENINAVFDAKTELPVKAQYKGKPIAINEGDVVFSLSNAAAGTFDGFNFIANKESGLKVVTITAALTADSTKTGSVKVSLYDQGEMSFDFDMATGGDRSLAWYREVSNSTTDDNNIYEVDKLGEPMVTTYTFALDMSQITMPEQLEDLTYMLPGADDPNASAWNFMLQLAERISVLTEVSATIHFDENFDVDYSNMKIVCEYFVMKDPAKDIVFDPATNSLTVTMYWKDQTQAIPAESADPLCMISGIKLTPKADAAWDAKDRLIPVHTGEINYNIFLRANALYTFASKEANQKEYGLLPFENPEVISGGSTEKGGSFKSTYKTFEDTYTLINAVKNGWVGAEGGYMYYVNGEYYTGIQEVDGFWYDFGENGICIGQHKYNGLFKRDGKTHYARFGVLVKNDWMSVGDDRYRFDANGDGLHGTVEIDEVELFFENGKLVGGFSGFITKSDGKTYLYNDGVLTLGWYLLDGDWYHFDTGTGAMNTGTHVMPDAEAKSKGAYYDFAPDGKLLCGYFNNAGYYYWPDLIDATTDSHTGTGRPKINQWVQSGSVADDWPANGATKDAWYRTNSHGHFVTGGSDPKVFDYVVDGVTHKAIVIAINNREYTFDNNYGYLLRGFFSYENDNWFYYWMDETVKSGWFDVDGETYYAYPDGHLATGSHVIDGQAYMFNERGQLIRDGLRLFVTVNADNTLMTITTSETTGLSNVRMAVWSNANNRADLQWFEAKVDQKGQWSVTVPLCQYEQTGIYQIHTYGVNAEGTDGLLVNTTTNVVKTAQHMAGEAEKVITKEPNCTETGSYDLIVHCTLCGEVLSTTTESIDALGHKPGTAVAENATEGACVLGGTYESVVYCSVCQAELSRETVTVPAEGHEPGEAVKENEVLPTCTTAGSYDMVTYCSICHEELTRETTTVDALGHKPSEAVKENEVLPACTTAGSYDLVTYCSICHEELTRETTTVDALGHKPGEAVKENVVEVTCTTDGSYESVVYCSVCEEELSRETVTVESEGHTYGEATRANVIEPTCTINGSYDKVIRCTACNEILETQHIVLPAPGHVDADEDGNCDVCDKDLDGEEEEEIIETIAMLRLYNPNTGEHFYTGSEEERDMLVEAGWLYEGIAWHAPVNTGAPIYRLYNPNSGDHHYSGSEVERDHLVSLGWQYEGVAWNTMGQTNSPQYRLYNPNADIGSHHYTGSTEERDYLMSLGWKYEGIAWYGCDEENPAK